MKVKKNSQKICVYGKNYKNKERIMRIKRVLGSSRPPGGGALPSDRHPVLLCRPEVGNYLNLKRNRHSLASRTEKISQKREKSENSE